MKTFLMSALVLGLIAIAGQNASAQGFEPPPSYECAIQMCDFMRDECAAYVPLPGEGQASKTNKKTPKSKLVNAKDGGADVQGKGPEGSCREFAYYVVYQECGFEFQDMADPNKNKKVGTNSVLKPVDSSDNK